MLSVEGWDGSWRNKTDIPVTILPPTVVHSFKLWHKHFALLCACTFLPQISLFLCLFFPMGQLKTPTAACKVGSILYPLPTMLLSVIFRTSENSPGCLNLFFPQHLLNFVLCTLIFILIFGHTCFC